MMKNRQLTIKPATGYQQYHLYAEIKRSSKYYGQADPGTLFPIEIREDPGNYSIKGGPGGQHRPADVWLYILDRNGKPTRLQGK